MWQKQLYEGLEIMKIKPLYSYNVDHVNGVIIGEGPAVIWGEKHPYGWDNLGQVISFLYERLEADGFTGREHERKSLMTDLKEKYGGIRLYIHLYDEDRSAYKSILSEALNKFPGSAPFFQVDEADETEVYVGTEKDFKNWESQLKSGDLERIVKGVIDK